MTDRDLVRLYWPVALRPAFDALFAIDDAMAEVVRTTSEPALGAIRLAWWREALERLDTSPPPAEPRLQAAASELLPRAISGRDLAGLEAGWTALLDEPPWDEAVVEAIAERGRRFFAIGATLLGVDDDGLNDAGAIFAIANAVRHCSDRASAQMLVEAGRRMSHQRFAKTLRPLTALTALSVRDLTSFPTLEVEASPARAVTLLRHRMTGRI